MNKPLLPDQIRSLTPLNALSPRQLQSLRDQLIPRPLLANQWLFDGETELGSSYFLLTGSLSMQGADGVAWRMFAGSPESCHVFSAGSRLIQVQALEDSSVLVVDSALLDRSLAWHQSHSDLLLQLATTGELTEWLEELLENPLFAKVPAENVRSMLGKLEAIELPAGHVLLHEGDAGDCCYFLKSGRAEVMIGFDSDEQVVAELGVGACVGEEALLTESPRNATVTLLEESCVLRLARQDFIALLKAPVVAELGLAQANELVAQGAQWLDVRLLDEYQRGHALQALNMPLHLLRLKARLLKQDRVYLCYCDSGKRSASAVFLLTQLGFTAYPLRDGLDALSAEEYAALLCEQGSGYLARSGGRTERSG
ncbi:cyclic nucleotide-binding domain-containing protein [Pseudomonas sp. KSR10]|jgi:CRP-like cAMP-binding protein|uniref:cAMP-binding protein n=1 Tax=Stutzerimonas stutzeri TaxID=316 RepID=A0A0D9AKR9_STUST|nr:MULTISPECIES: cyclic nucleotide-binding domain-containing protein [Pseudomonadaceae]KJH81598.1 cAMP-binding protein [Stutzerimonas stutzeri]MCG6540120.1 cyclic nucleotide-binding domain-containing protein [Pseudomonas sp. KSR10]